MRRHRRIMGLFDRTILDIVRIMQEEIDGRGELMRWGGDELNGRERR